MSMNLGKRTIPPLRDDLELEQTSGERLPFAIIDRTLGQKVRIDQRGAMLASALDRSWQPVELLDALASGGLRLDPNLLVRFVRFLDAHYLFVGSRAEQRIAAVQSEDAAAPTHSNEIGFLPGTRHNCVACGASCGGHDIGPIAPAQVAVIRDEVPSAQFIERKTRDAETTGSYCAMADDACVFLNAERLCSIHAALGMDKKPTDCRVFPLAFTRTPTGVRVGVRLECRSYLASKHNGGALEERGDELQTLLSQVDTISEVPDLVRLDEAVTLPWPRYVALQETLQDTVLAPAPNTTALSLLSRVNDRALDLLKAARETEREAWVFPPDSTIDTGVSRQAVLNGLADACASCARLNAAAGNTKRAARLQRLEDSARRLCDGPPPDLGGPQIEELLRDHLSQSLFLADPALGPHVRFGMGLLNLGVALALATTGAKDDFNLALADALKGLRSGPVMSQLHELDGPVAEHFHDRLKDWLGV